MQQAANLFKDNSSNVIGLYAEAIGNLSRCDLAMRGVGFFKSVVAQCKKDMKIYWKLPVQSLDKHVETDGFDRGTEVDDEENETSYTRCYCRNMEVTIDDGAVFFTEAAANDYIHRNQKRHSEKLYVYVDSGHRNPEWQEIRNFLLSLTEKE